MFPCPNGGHQRILLLTLQVLSGLADCSIVQFDAALANELSRFLRLSNVTVVSSHVGHRAGSKRSFFAGKRAGKVHDSAKMDHCAWGSSETPIIDLTQHPGNHTRAQMLFECLAETVTTGVLVVKDDDQIPELSPFRLNQEVYFLSVDSGFVSESYTVGEASINTQLARYVQDARRFVPLEGAVRSLEARRSNFQGAHLKVFVCQQVPYFKITPSDQGEADVEHIHGTLKLNVAHPDRLTGIFRDIQVK